MANPKFCYPNWLLPTRFTTPTISGPGWIDLQKLQGDLLSEMARFPGVDPAATRLTVDLGTTRNIRVLVLPFHNAQPGDTARIRVASDAAFTDVLIDTGFKEFFGEVFSFGTLEWGSAQWLDGRYGPEQAAGLMPAWMHIAAADVFGRYLDVQLNFSGNSAGYIDLGQIVASPVLSPAYNFSYGVAPPYYRDPSTSTRSKGGPRFSNRSRSYLATKMQLDWLSTDELYGAFYEMVRDYGTTKPFYFIYNSDAAPALLQKQSFMATAESFGAPTNTSFGNNSLAIEISQAF